MRLCGAASLLELPNDEEEVNTRDIHKCDGQAHDTDTMTTPLTPKPTRKAETLAKAPPTIVSRRKEDAGLKEVAKAWLCCANDIFETKTKDGSTAAKAPAPRTNPNTKEAKKLGCVEKLVVYYESMKRKLI